jgi:hypothetical protein
MSLLTAALAARSIMGAYQRRIHGWRSLHATADRSEIGGPPPRAVVERWRGAGAVERARLEIA